MRTRIVTVFGLLVVLLSGCSSSPPQKAEPVAVTVLVMLPSGQPGKDLSLLLLPTSDGQVQYGGKTDVNGKVQAKLTPGKYTFAFESTTVAVPKKYHINDPANAVDVTEQTKDLTITLIN